MKLDSLIQEIDASEASQNLFFELAASEPAHAVAPELIAREWFPVTRAYGLSLASYIGILADLAFAAGDGEGTWESALLIPTRLYGEEMQWGVSGRHAIHHNLFRGLERCWTSGSPAAAGGWESRQALVDAIRTSLKDPFLGAGTILVIERTAWRIVEAFSHLVAVRGIDPRSVPYLEIHLRIEPEHSREAERLVTLVSKHPGAEAGIAAGARELSALLGRYWNTLAESVFNLAQAE